MLFGSSKRVPARSDVMLPGVITGYGGGTFDIDGTPVTDRDGLPMQAPQARSQGYGDAGVMTGPGGTPLPDRSLALAQPRQASPIAMRGEWENTFPAMQQQPAAKAQRLRWMDGGKANLGDILKIALSVLGDVGTNQAGGQGHSVENLFGQRKANMERQRISTALRNQGYNDDQVTLAMIDPGSLGKNYNEQFGTRVVAPGSSVIGATPFGQRPQYRQPTDGEQYAAAQGLEPGSPDYATALQDYTLRGNGPTAFGFDQQLDDERTDNDIRLEGTRQAGRIGLEGLRQRNRAGLEGIRQGNRVDLRGIPQARAPGLAAGRPRASARRTATGPNGQKIEWDGSKWVPAR